MFIAVRFSWQCHLPDDINVLIGPNGAGESQLHHQIEDDWLQMKPYHQEPVGFKERPRLSQVGLVSHSAFELFPVETGEDKRHKDHDVSRYLDCRDPISIDAAGTAPHFLTARVILPDTDFCACRSPPPTRARLANTPTP